ncbi:methyltransferase [Candidatus Woesearchaeota archaeon]|nr:methyltransferase [Candidatus Woesearchaeota archaeon]
MKYFVTTFEGAEDIVEKEIKERVKAKIEKQKGFLILDKKEDLENLRSIVRTGVYLKHFKVKDLKDYKKQIKDIDFSFINEEFAVYCERLGNHKFSSKEIEIATAEKIKAKVNLTSPKVLVYIKIRDEDCLIGTDLFQKRIDKPDYRIKPHPNSLNSAIAYIGLNFSEYKPKNSILDFFCGSGIIPIEAALMGGKEVYASDNQYYCTEAASINSKVAGVKINLSKTKLEDINKKFKKKFDFIVTDPPIATFRGLNDIYYLYDIMFEKAFTLLKPKGTFTIITTRPQPLIEDSGKFKLKKQLILDKNSLKYYILIFKK